MKSTTLSVKGIMEAVAKGISSVLKPLEALANSAINAVMSKLGVSDIFGSIDMGPIDKVRELASKLTLKIDLEAKLAEALRNAGLPDLSTFANTDFLGRIPDPSLGLENFLRTLNGLPLGGLNSQLLAPLMCIVEENK